MSRLSLDAVFIIILADERSSPVYNLDYTILHTDWPRTAQPKINRNKLMTSSKKGKQTIIGSQRTALANQDTVDMSVCERLDTNLKGAGLLKSEQLLHKRKHTLQQNSRLVTMGQTGRNSALTNITVNAMQVLTRENGGEKHSTQRISSQVIILKTFRYSWLTFIQERILLKRKCHDKEFLTVDD